MRPRSLGKQVVREEEQEPDFRPLVTELLIRPGHGGENIVHATPVRLRNPQPKKIPVSKLCASLKFLEAELGEEGKAYCRWLRI